MLLRHLLLPLLLLPYSAVAGEQLECQLTRPARSLELSQEMIEGQGVVATKEANDLGLGLDASLSRQSFLLVMQDELRQERLAFTSSPLAVSVDGATLSGNESNVKCRKKTDAPAPLSPPPTMGLPDYLVCVLDEVLFEKGEVVQSKPRLLSVKSPLNRHLPIQSKAESETAAFTVDYLAYDPFRGLNVQLVDKTNGKRARFTGSAHSLRPSFLLGLTQGNRAENAKFLRLGCVWTNDPKAFKE